MKVESKIKQIMEEFEELFIEKGFGLNHLKLTDEEALKYKKLMNVTLPDSYKLLIKIYNRQEYLVNFFAKFVC